MIFLIFFHDTSFIFMLQKRLKKFKHSEREKKRKSMTKIEQQLDREEERMELAGSDDELTEYEKRRLENMREKFEFFKELDFSTAKRQLAVPKPERKRTEKEVLPPRRPSTRIKNIKEKEQLMQKQSKNVVAASVKDLGSIPIPAVQLSVKEVLSVTMDKDVGARNLDDVKAVLLNETRPACEAHPDSLVGSEVVRGVCPGLIMTSAIYPDPSANLLVFGDNEGTC